MSKATTENSPDETKTCPLCGGRVFWFPVSNYWGCERCKNTFNRYTVFPDEVKKTSASAVGNAAAMREALVELVYVIDMFDGGKPLWWHNNAKGVMALKKARAALAEPPRNCDVGTAEEQVVRFRDAMTHECFADEYCRCKDAARCFARWVQTPYEEGEDNGGK